MYNQFNKKPIEWVVNENGCFICTSHHKNEEGYIKIKRQRKMIGLHRYIYEEMFGFVPKDLVVRHKCDNPSCINPEHLELGTHKDNANDKKIRKRARTCNRKGENNTQAKLNWEKVRKIRQDNRLHKEIAKDYGVCKTTIGLIKNNKLWKEENENE